MIMKPAIGIKPEHTVLITEELSKILADEFVLSTHIRNAHWNVEGADFYTSHQFFHNLYKQIDEIIDEVAERIRTLGHYAPASLKEFEALTRLTPQNRDKNDSQGFIKNLLAHTETIIYHLREIIFNVAVNFLDIGTSDFITGIMSKHEKMAWMLRANLK